MNRTEIPHQQAGIQHTVVYNQSTRNIPKHLLLLSSIVPLYLSWLMCLLWQTWGALYQAIPYMPVHTNINPLVCCCFVYKCGPLASLNGQQLVFVWIIGTRLFQQFRQPIRTNWADLSLSLSCPCLASDDCNSSLGPSTHQSPYISLFYPFWTLNFSFLVFSSPLAPLGFISCSFTEVELKLKFL